MWTAEGVSSGSESVYEDDGHTTGYLTDASYAWTTCSYVTLNSDGGDVMTVNISTKVSGGFKELPASRAYQLRLVNGAPIASVTTHTYIRTYIYIYPSHV